MNTLRKALSSFIHFQDLKSNCFTFTPLGSGMVGATPANVQVDHMIRSAWSKDNPSPSLPSDGACGYTCS